MYLDFYVVFRQVNSHFIMHPSNVRKVHLRWATLLANSTRPRPVVFKISYIFLYTLWKTNSSKCRGCRLASFESFLPTKGRDPRRRSLQRARSLLLRLLAAVTSSVKPTVYRRESSRLLGLCLLRNSWRNPWTCHADRPCRGIHRRSFSPENIEHICAMVIEWLERLYKLTVHEHPIHVLHCKRKQYLVVSSFLHASRGYKADSGESRARSLGHGRVDEPSALPCWSHLLSS